MSMETKHTPDMTRALVLAYRRHEGWARRSGFAPMEWADFKQSRTDNPLARAAIARALGKNSD
jgi:hypothetical protein